MGSCRLCVRELPVRTTFAVLVWLGCWIAYGQDQSIGPGTAQSEPSASLDTAADHYQALDAAYMAADSLAKRKTSMAELRRLVDTFSDDYGILWRSARMIWFIGDGLHDDAGQELRDLGLEGMDYADRALAAEPDGIEGHYYKALTVSTYSRGISIVKALVKGLGGEYERCIQFVLDRDETFDRGGALRAFGRYYWKLPWPKYDYKKSLSYLDRALEIDPTVLRTHYYRGDTLWALKRYAEARQAFEKVLQTEPTLFDKKDAAWIKAQTKKRLALLLKKEF